MAVPLFVALALVGCRDRGGDDATATPANDSTPTTATNPTFSPAQIPSSTPESGASLPPFEAGAFERTITVDGRDREYRLYVPASLGGQTAAPLVVGMHGGFGNSSQFANTTRFGDQADEGGFIAAYPQGLGAIPTWNGGRCCGFAAREDIDDVTFIEAMIDEISRSYAVDPSRVYAAGHSNGGIMALRLACESDRFAAVAAVAGSLETSSCNAKRAVSVLIIHGDADENHPLEGGRGDESVSQVAFTSVADSLALLAHAMGCSDIQEASIEGPLTTTDRQGCPPGVGVRLIVIAGASHAWPGGKQGVIFSAEPSQDLDATEAIWAFFSQ